MRSDGSAGGCLVFAKDIAIGGRRLTALGVVLGQRSGALVQSALASARRLGDSVAAAVRMQTVLPAGSRVLRVRNVDGQTITAATAGALREIGWSGLTLPVKVLARTAVTQLRAGERAATVSVGGADRVATSARATRALAGPSLGWHLTHLL